MRRAAHAVVPQVGEHHLDRFGRVGRLQIVRQHAPSVREDGLLCENPDNPECRSLEAHFYHAQMTPVDLAACSSWCSASSCWWPPRFACTDSRPGTATPTSIQTNVS